MKNNKILIILFTIIIMFSLFTSYSCLLNSKTIKKLKESTNNEFMLKLKSQELFNSKTLKKIMIKLKG